MGADAQPGLRAQSRLCMVEAYRDGDTAPREDTMTRISAHTITVPAEVTDIAIEAWDAEDGTNQGIIWDRTGLKEEDGQWGGQLIDWEGDLDDIIIRLRNAGFEVSKFSIDGIGDDAELFATATR